MSTQTKASVVFDAVDSSHVPKLSNPSLVIDVIRTAANSVQERLSDRVHAAA
jgi:hypothetical protein